MPLLTLLSNLAAGLGSPFALSLALPYGTTLNSHDRIDRIAVCAGSGGSVFSKIPSDNGVAPRQLYVTGEMSHYEALAATENGICLVCLGHSNSERGYLWNGMRARLIEELKERWTEARREMAEARVFEEHVEVLVSRCDRDPFGTLVMEKRSE